MSPVQRVASLEGDSSVPAGFGENLADFAGGENVLAKLGVLRLWQSANRSADEVGVPLLAVQNHIGSRVIDAVGQVNLLQILELRPGVDVFDIEGRDDFTRRIRQSDLLASLEFLRLSGSDRERDRNRPGI